MSADLDRPLPIEHVVINGLPIRGSAFGQGLIDHDIDAGTVTLTLVAVRSVEVLYTHEMGDHQRDRFDPYLIAALKPLIDWYGAQGVTTAVNAIAAQGEVPA